ncbi:hypothetical protein C7S20_11615 [Christiangramia fulva]|uniref:Uncharacterized protein n=1 Tax=Christiangramia fulva TaxID=2126553 RepID=A0A2R3Z6E3_9FLAO|nr:hypothetical protein C7S20_11615 [Christiangramia fulva]
MHNTYSHYSANSKPLTIKTTQKAVRYRIFKKNLHFGKEMQAAKPSELTLTIKINKMVLQEPVLNLKTVNCTFCYTIFCLNLEL